MPVKLGLVYKHNCDISHIVTLLVLNWFARLFKDWQRFLWGEHHKSLYCLDLQTIQVLLGKNTIIVT